MYCSINIGEFEMKLTLQVLYLLMLLSLAIGCKVGSDYSPQVQPKNMPKTPEVSTQDVQKQVAQYEQVTAYMLNLRQKPSVHSKIIGTLRKGDDVKVLGQKNNWIKVQALSLDKGWVYGAYLTHFEDNIKKPKKKVAIKQNNSNQSTIHASSGSATKTPKKNKFSKSSQSNQTQQNISTNVTKKQMFSKKNSKVINSQPNDPKSSKINNIASTNSESISLAQANKPDEVNKKQYQNTSHNIQKKEHSEIIMQDEETFSPRTELNSEKSHMPSENTFDLNKSNTLNNVNNNLDQSKKVDAKHKSAVEKDAHKDAIVLNGSRSDTKNSQQDAYTSSDILFDTKNSDSEEYTFSQDKSGQHEDFDLAVNQKQNDQFVESGKTTSHDNLNNLDDIDDEPQTKESNPLNIVLKRQSDNIYVPIYSGPYRDAKIITKVEAGKHFQVIGYEDGWYEIMTKEGKGFVQEMCIKRKP